MCMINMGLDVRNPVFGGGGGGGGGGVGGWGGGRTGGGLRTTKVQASLRIHAD